MDRLYTIPRRRLTE
ncbi:hypothetical protein LINPERHAP1_LOCUS38865 [Linum perenne]